MSVGCLSNKLVIICHNLREYQSVVTLEHAAALFMAVSLTDLTNAGPRLAVINSFIYNDFVALNSLVRWVQQKAPEPGQENVQEGGEASGFFLFLVGPLYSTCSGHFILFLSVPLEKLC